MADMDAKWDGVSETTLEPLVKFRTMPPATYQGGEAAAVGFTPQEVLMPFFCVVYTNLVHPALPCC